MPLLPSLRRLTSAGSTQKSVSLPIPSHALENERLLLRLGQPLDWQAWRDLRGKSRAFLTPWEPSWLADALTFDAYTSSLRRQWREWKEGRGYTFLIFMKGPHGNPFVAFNSRGGGQGQSHAQDGPHLIGGIALSPVERGPMQRGRLGYWVGAPFARQGLMTQAAEMVLAFGFNTLDLHRIEASCMPSNEPSQKLLARLGFEKEGTAQSYLRIAGKWEDHEIWGKIAPAKAPQSRPST